MQFVISYEGETLSELVQRLYCQASDAECKRIVGLVRQANPDLKATKGIPKGTVVIIPQVEGIEASSDVRTERQIAASLIRNAREQISDIGPTLDQLVNQQEKEAQAILELAKSREVRKLAKTESIVRDRLVDITKDSQEKLKRTKVLRSVNKKAIDELESDLDELLAGLDPGGAPPPKPPEQGRK